MTPSADADEPAPTGLRKARMVAAFRARQLVRRLPPTVETALVRRRHLRLVTANMGDRTDPAYLGRAPADVVSWISPGSLPDPPTLGLSPYGFGPAEADAAREWLDAGPYDTDDLLALRTDNYDDELGRTIAGLRERLAIASRPSSRHWAGGRRVLFDARCLQMTTLGPRGIGRFARSALLGSRAAVGDDRLVLLVDPGLDELDPDLAGSCATVSRVTSRTVAAYSVLIEPSPMTSSYEPILALLHSTAHKLALVFDFIPLHYPTVYLSNPAARAEYAAALDGLRLFDDFICISHLARAELALVLGRPFSGMDGDRAHVAWPREVLPSRVTRRSVDRNGPIVVMTGDEPRKNTFGALAAIGAATAGSAKPRDVVVLGMSGHEALVHHLSIWAAMRPGEAATASRLPDDEMDALLRRASLVVVASFDEGLSLPVIEALRAGVPVVASDIPAHRELLGTGSYLADPTSPASMERAIRRHRGRSATAARQLRALAEHEHDVLEDLVAARIRGHARSTEVDLPAAAVFVGGRQLKVGIATPWVPQRTGVADFSTTTTLELARLCDVTVYTTADARVRASAPEGLRIANRPVAQAPSGRDHEDVFVSVVGNSHFHVPFLDLVEGSVVVSHDTRLVELYMALRGPGGVEKLMLRGTGERALRPALDDQIDDMRLLQNAGFWEVARRARMLILHSASAAPRIAAETGVTPHVLPFANQRVPQQAHLTAADRDAARARLGLDGKRIHLASFGFVDERTKMTDVVVEAAGWLSQWGHPVGLHLVGAASEEDSARLSRRAHEAGVADFEITGYLDDSRFRDYLLAVDAGVQLRIDPMLGVSGPLSDLAAFGTPSVASSGLAIDVDTPAYVDRLPDQVSPVMVAEAIERLLAQPMPVEEVEQERRAYLERKSPRRYAEALLGLLTDVARTPGREEG